MKKHIVIDGNAFYEVDEECLRVKQEQEELKKRQQEKCNNRKMNMTYNRRRPGY